jgi:hypothetical protein
MRAAGEDPDGVRLRERVIVLGRGSPLVSVSVSVTNTQSPLMVVRELVAPRPVYSASTCTMALPIATRTAPSAG